MPPREQNRILEMHGLMGSIGEQLGMGWTAEQDAQRLLLTTDQRDELTTRLMLRALSELVGHFILGATHSLANLVPSRPTAEPQCGSASSGRLQGGTVRARLG